MKMLLCNAIVGNYDYGNYTTFSDKLLSENKIVSSSVDLNDIYLIFRVNPSKNEGNININQGLVVKYYFLKNLDEHGNINFRKHYLIPVFNELNELSYWISSKFLRIKRDEMYFSISSYIKEYWKCPTLVEEFVENNNILCIGNIKNKYLNYNRIINIEKQNKIQVLCINLQYGNSEYIIINDLCEFEKNEIESNNEFEGNSTIKDFESTYYEATDDKYYTNFVNNYERLNKNESSIGNENSMGNQNESKYKSESQCNLIASNENKDVVDLQYMSSNIGTTKSYESIEKEDKIECVINKQLEINSKTELNSFSICNQESVNIVNKEKLLNINNNNSDTFNNNSPNIITRKACTENKTENNQEDIFEDNFEDFNNSCLSDKSQDKKNTLLVIDDMITPIIRQIKNRKRIDKNIKNINSKTDIVNRNNFLYNNEEILSNNIISTCKVNNFYTSFLPSNLQIKNKDELNKELLILNRIETARKNVDLNHRIYNYTQNHINNFNNRIFTSENTFNEKNKRIYNINNFNTDNNYIINLSSQKFNQIIGKTDYLLEQLNNFDNSFKIHEHNLYKNFDCNYINKFLSSRSTSTSLNLNNSNKFFFENILEIKKKKTKNNDTDSNSENNDDKSLNLSNSQLKTNFNYTQESNLSIISENIKKMSVDVEIGTEVDINQGFENNFVTNSKMNNLEKIENVKKVIKRNSIVDPELVEVDFYINGDKLRNSFSIMNVILSRWSGIPIISRL